MVKVSGLGFVLKGEHLVAFEGSGDDLLGFGVQELDKIFL